MQVPERPRGRERIRQDTQRKPFLPPDREGRGRSRGRAERLLGARNAARQPLHHAERLGRWRSGVTQAQKKAAMMRRFMAAFLRTAEKDRPRATVGHTGL